MVMKPKILLLAVFFLAFLALPMIMVLARSFTADGTAGITFSNYVEVLTEKGFLQALGNSLLISVCSALVTTVLAFILAYTIHYTNVGRRYKKLVEKAAVLPMLWEACCTPDGLTWEGDTLSGAIGEAEFTALCSGEGGLSEFAVEDYHLTGTVTDFTWLSASE